MNFSENITPLILALLSGLLMAVQGSLNAALSKIIGLLETTFVVHSVGTVILLAALFIFGLGKGDIRALPQVPWYLYLGGVISIFIIYLVAASIPRLGMANATTAIIVGQVLTALAIDYFGGFGLERVNVSGNDCIGLLLLAGGAYLLLR